MNKVLKDVHFKKYRVKFPKPKETIDMTDYSSPVEYTGHSGEEEEGSEEKMEMTTDGIEEVKAETSGETKPTQPVTDESAE